MSEMNKIFYPMLLFILFGFQFLLSQNPISLYTFLFFTVYLWISVLNVKNNTQKIYYVLPLPILVIQGIILVYTSFFRSLYLNIGFLIFFFLLFIWWVVEYYNIYKHREEFVRGKIKYVYTLILDKIKG